MLETLSFLDQPLSQTVSLVTFDRLEEKMSIAFNKSEVKLEYQEFSKDIIVRAMTSTDKSEVEFWVKVMKMRSPMDSSKYENLASITLQMLSIPVLNAD